MGFDRDAIVNVTFPGDSVSNSKIDYLRSSLDAIPGIKDISFNSQPPATDDNNWTDYKYDNAQKYNGEYCISKWVDADYLKTYGLTLIAGRNFSSDTAHEVMINERLLRDLGVKRPEDVLNKQMDIYRVVGPIVGVVKDFNSTGFKDKYCTGFSLLPNKRWYQHVGK